MNQKIEVKTVSIDMSTSDEDAGNRIFGKVIDRVGDNILCEFESANYDFKQEEAVKILNQQLLEENKEFRKVLAFYANRRNFDFQNEKELRFCNSDDQAEVFQPFGTKAKEILKKFK